MNLSAILVVVPVAALGRALDALRGLPGLDIHHVDGATGRIVVTQEAESMAAEVDGLRSLQALPDVVRAEMVYHYFEEDDEVRAALAARRASETSSAVPPFLDD